MLHKGRPFACLSPSWCAMCGKNSESLNHLSLHPEVAAKLCSWLVDEAGFIWVTIQSC